MEIIKSLNVEKLNVCENDGTVKMTLFNSQNVPPIIFDGVDLIPGHRQTDNLSGIMFYNGEGIECGGLIFGSKVDEQGKQQSGVSLTMDQYRQDQLVQMSVMEYDGEQQYGISIFDRPKCDFKESVETMNQIGMMPQGTARDEAVKKLVEENPQRLFLGKNTEGEIMVKLNDRKGNPRIKMAIDDNDIPRLEFYDEKGHVIYTLPPIE